MENNEYVLSDEEKLQIAALTSDIVQAEQKLLEDKYKLLMMKEDAQAVLRAIARRRKLDDGAWSFISVENKFVKRG